MVISECSLSTAINLGFHPCLFVCLIFEINLKSSEPILMTLGRIVDHGSRKNPQNFGEERPTPPQNARFSTYQPSLIQ